MAIMDMIIAMIDRSWFSSSLSFCCFLGGVSSSGICMTVCVYGCISVWVDCVRCVLGLFSGVIFSSFLVFCVGVVCVDVLIIVCSVHVFVARN